MWKHHLMGCIETSISVENTSSWADFLVVPEANTTILGYNIALLLHMLRVGPDKPTYAEYWAKGPS